MPARDPFEDAVLYDWEYRRRRDDVLFYGTLADERGGPPPGATPAIPTDLGSLAAAARSLVAPVRPTFLGTGAFGGPWHSRTD